MQLALRHHLERWLFRLHRRETLPIVLSQRRVFVLPTGPGYVFAVTLLLMLAGSINYSLNLGHGLTFLLAGVGLSALVHTFRNLVALRIHPLRGDAGFAGEPARFLLRLENPSGHARQRLRLQLQGQPTVWTDLPAYGDRIVVLKCATRRRGRLPLGRLTLETRYPLGLVRAWAYAEPDMYAIVWPAPEHDPPAFPDQAGETAGRRTGQEGDEDFSGLRTHLPGEALRHIAWRAVARRHEEAPLLAKRFDGQAGADLHFDWFALDGLDAEQRASRLTAWLLRAHTEGRRWSLHLADASLPQGRGDRHLRRGLDLLALTTPHAHAGDTSS